MMCACEQDFATKYLPHQIAMAQDIETKERVPVTDGFRPGICNSCRGLPEQPCPKKAMHGSTSKVVRYYWREIQMLTIESFAKWAKQRGASDWIRALAEHRDQYDECHRQAIASVKKHHQTSPKYVYSDRSQSEVIAQYNVPVVPLEADYRPGEDGRPRLRWKDRFLSPEEFAAEKLRNEGFDVLFTESVPFHALFGTMMWMLIQDPGDPRVRTVMFGDRLAFDEQRPGERVYAALPQDFGSAGYALRRSDAITKHLKWLPMERDEFLWTFDHWVEPSTSLRQYLWAHRTESVNTARKIISVFPVETVKQILGYLVGNYWARYCGWPDLLIHKGEEFCLAEVKSSKDKLSENQMNWIQGNSEHLGLPFKIAKIHRKRERRLGT